MTVVAFLNWCIKRSNVTKFIKQTPGLPPNWLIHKNNCKKLKLRVKKKEAQMDSKRSETDRNVGFWKLSLVSLAVLQSWFLWFVTFDAWETYSWTRSCHCRGEGATTRRLVSFINSFSNSIRAIPWNQTGVTEPLNLYGDVVELCT